MELVQTRPLAAARAEILIAATLAALAAILVVALAPPGGDAAAHLYRTELVRDGVLLWDNLWFAGHHPLVSYSVLYYLLAAVVGNVPLVTAAAVAAAALFAALALDAWGDAARWPARAFAVASALPLYTGTYSYALGVAAGLAALRLVQTGRPWWAVAAAAATLGASPLAFAFLVLALAAAALASRPPRRTVAIVAGGVAAVAVVEAALLALFPSEGRYPYSPLSLAGVLAASALGAVLAARSARGRELAAFFVLWGLANAAAFAVPSPFGDNLARLRYVLLPLLLLAVLLARARPRALAVAALTVGLVYNLGPDVSALPKRAADARTAGQEFWAPALRFLEARRAPLRVEVVPTFGHWEAYRVPRAGIGLARGWYRQLDLAQNPQLYRRPLEPAAYRAWLRRLGVRFVLLPRARLGPLGAEREAALLTSGRSGLVPVFRSRDWRIWELPDARLLEGPAGAALTRLDHERVAGNVAAPGVYRLRVRHTPLLRVRSGDVCLAPAPRDGGSTRLVARGAGPFELEVGGPAEVLRSAAGSRSRC